MAPAAAPAVSSTSFAATPGFHTPLLIVDGEKQTGLRPRGEDGCPQDLRALVQHFDTVDEAGSTLPTNSSPIRIADAVQFPNHGVACSSFRPDDLVQGGPWGSPDANDPETEDVDEGLEEGEREEIPVKTGRHSPWKEYAKELSWVVYLRYSRFGQPVDLVGHSMGGLIIRGAIQGSRNHEPGFSPPIDVEDAVTIGTPHKGGMWRPDCMRMYQCAGLQPNSEEVVWLRQDPLPQGLHGTDWTNIGSSGDPLVLVSSSNSMPLAATAKPVLAGVTHYGYLGRTDVRDLVAKAIDRPDY
jgi:hypothetical protein